MANLMTDKSTKALIITSLNDNLYPFLSFITDRKMKDLLILNSYWSVVSSPNNSAMRNILLAMVSHNIEEIYIVGSNDSKSLELIGSHQSIEMSCEDCQSVNDEVIVKNYVRLIKDHQLVPKTTSVQGYIVDTKNEIYERVRGEID
ncbi:hypothetical protein [Salirhabdus salicampi]|uniref:hypothetical protein n=1 Tax=Salirhabdus salicampi TaxID=476102 RepID=UPI0020C3CE82|nr:hypothetical protein [Salirhabdus salicampi]MCP8615371.1 hypothetical protein [Salirhabdus salicampi]